MTNNKTMTSLPQLSIRPSGVQIKFYRKYLNTGALCMFYACIHGPAALLLRPVKEYTGLDILFLPLLVRKNGF